MSTRIRSSFPHHPDGPARGCLRRDVSDGRAATRAAEPAVRDERHLAVQTAAGNRRRGREHLRHARAASRPLVADHDHVPGPDGAAQDGLLSLFLAVEYAGGALVPKHRRIHRGFLHHAPFGRQVAFQHREPAIRMVRFGRAGDERAVGLRCACVQRAEGGAAYRQGILLDPADASQGLQNRHHSTRGVQMLHVVGAGWRQGAQMRHHGAHGIEIVQAQGDAGGCRECRQVERRVGRAPQRHVQGHGVQKGLPSHDSPRAEAGLHRANGGPSRLSRKDDPVGEYRRDGPVPGKRHAQSFREAIHRIGREEPRARARTGADAALQGRELLVGHLAAGVSADGFEDRLQADVPTLDRGQHGPARQHDGGDVDPRRGHEHARDDLVAARQKHEPIQPVGPGHDFHGVRDEVTAGEGVAHPDVAHRQPVTDADGPELECHTTFGPDALSDGIREPPKVLVARDELAVGVGNADHGPAPQGRVPSQRMEQAAVGRAGRALLNHAAGCALCAARHVSFLSPSRWRGSRITRSAAPIARSAPSKKKGRFPEGKRPAPGTVNASALTLPGVRGSSQGGRE